MSQSDFVNRGQALVASGQFQEAVKVCRLGLLGRPTTVEGRIVLGQALLALKRFDEVLAEMRVALELDHTSITAQILQGEALLRKGDPIAACEILERARALAPGDPHLMQLIADAKRNSRPSLTASNPSVSFVGGAATSESTKHYPNHGAEEEDTANAAEEDTGGEYTRPTSLSAPGSKKRSNRVQAMGAELPSAAELAVGDRSGTVEVDPEADGIEIEPDDDFGELAAPPIAGRRPVAHGDEPRGSVQVATEAPTAHRRSPRRGEVSSVELESQDLIEVDDSLRRAPGPGTAVRNAVKMPSGPLDLLPQDPPAASRRTAIAPAQPPLARQIAQQPHLMHLNPVPMTPQPLPQPPRGPIAAALPTAAAMPMPHAMSPHGHGMPPQGHGMPPQGHGMPVAGAAQPTMALNAAQQQSAAAVDAMFGTPPPQQAQPWSQTMVAGSPEQQAQLQAHGRAVAAANEPTRQPHELDPRFAVEPSSISAAFGETGSAASGKPLKTGMRRARSRLQVVMWVVIGGAVIGGGVFAGFQIRALRLEKQIATARDQAVDLAKADTWQGWSGARDRLAGIAQASSTTANRAALARARGVLAYEFGEGFADAKAAVDRLGGGGGLAGALAASYVALAANDPKAAGEATAKATAIAPNDPAVLYVTGQAAMIAGDLTGAIAVLKTAQEREPRPLYAVGLARAIAMTGAWDDALAAVDRALGLMPDHPAALIQRALLLAASGRIAQGNPVTTEVRGQIVKLIAEGAKPLAEQAGGVSPAQVALANLALVQVDFALRDLKSAALAFRAARAVNVDDPRFAEEAIDTLLMIGQPNGARAAAEGALALWPGSQRARLALALTAVAMGKPSEALDQLQRFPEVVAQPRGLAVRGYARLATGDLDAARVDLDAALKRLPYLELALVARAWVDLEANDVDAARKRLTPRFNENTSSVAMTVVFAATLRRSADVADVEQAKALLGRVASGPVTADSARAQLELARVLRELGDVKGALNSFAGAAHNGNPDARLELGLLQIEDREPAAGRATLDNLLKDMGEEATSTLVLEAARARMLSGDNAGASELLDRADKLKTTARWHLERERARYLFRRNDFAGATQFILKALEGAGADRETFVIAADIVGTDPTRTQLAQRLKELADERLKGLPEGLIVTGKLAIAAGNLTEAEAAYVAAAKALDKSTPRRVAQAHYGLAVIAYMKKDDPTAQSQLDLVMEEDPSIYVAYLFAAEISGKASAAFALVKKAVEFNPDYAQGWYQVGQYAARLGKSKELGEAITKLGALMPGSKELAELQALRR